MRTSITPDGEAGADRRTLLHRSQMPDPPPARPVSPSHSPAAVAALLALSDERDKSLSLRLAAWREGWQSGHRDGWVAGYARAEADMAAAWQAVAGPVSRGESLIAQGWERRVADATAYSRRRAWAHWHDWQRRNGTEAAS